MLIVCPSCRHSIRVLDLRPGRFTPRCPRCERTFQIIVPEVRGRSPIVSVLEPSVFAQPVDLASEEPEPSAIPVLEWPAAGFDEFQDKGWGLLQGLPRGTPRLLGGHLLLRLLGHGPRGQTFLARAPGLRRLVVVKVAAPDRAADPVFLAHSLREAFAAAQIQHPNLVAIRALGHDRGRHFAVLEHGDGPALVDLVRDGTKLEPYLAASCILQAARGLKAAHAQGLLHRDIKPENLRLNRGGLVKVDDLGLEMTPSLAAAMEEKARPRPAAREARGSGSGRESAPAAEAAPAAKAVTVAIAGSPRFMPPEQASDARTIDVRADVYALGGTFCNLVTGRPPFLADSAPELARLHQEEALVPPREFVPRLPRPIDDAIRTMLGKRPDERYPNMSVVVEVLETILDVHGAGASAAGDDACRRIREADAALSGSSARRLRSRILASSAAIWIAFLVFLLSLGLVSAAMGILALGLVTALAVAAQRWRDQHSGLAHAASEFLLQPGPRSWALGGILALAAALGWWLVGLFPIVLLLGSAYGLAWAFHVYLDRPWIQERQNALEACRSELRNLRARGVAEDVILERLHTGGGVREDLAQALFGRDAGLALGQRDSGRRLVSHGCRWLEARRQSHTDRMHTRLLRAAEEARLEVSGLNLLTARRRALRIARAMIQTAAQWRDELHLARTPGAASALAGPPLLERLQRAIENPEAVLEPLEASPGRLSRRLNALADVLLGRGLRVWIGVGLFAALAAWLDARGIVTARQVAAQADELARGVASAIRTGETGPLRSLQWTIRPDWRRFQEPVEPVWVAEELRRNLRGSNLGLAGALLIVSALFRRRLVGFMALAGALVALLGPRWQVRLASPFGELDGQVLSMILAVLLFVLGLVLPRRQASE